MAYYARNGMSSHRNPFHGFGAYYARTGMISHRHPFHGFGANGAAGPAVPAPATSPTTPVQPKAAAPLSVLPAVVSGAIMGFVGYSLAKSMDVEVAKASGLGLTMGLVTVVGQLAGEWLKNQVEAAKGAVAPQPAAAPQSSSQIVTVPPVGPTPRSA